MATWAGATHSWMTTTMRPIVARTVKAYNYPSKAPSAMNAWKFYQFTRHGLLLNRKQQYASCARATGAMTIGRTIMIRPRTSPSTLPVMAAFSTTSRLDENTKIIAWWVPVVGGFLVTCAGGLTYFYQQVGSLEGLRRSLYFYSFAIPKYVEYRYHLWADSPQPVWDELDRRTSMEALQKVFDLEGFYIKCGQMCASNVGNAFPRIWQDTMAVLQDQVPAQPFDTIRSIVSAELDWDATFASFEQEPIGAASIGQVHRAVLRNENERNQQVVVKVCYPMVERLLRGDVRTVKLFAQLAQPVHVPALEEVEVQFATEFDYRREGAHLQEISENLERAGLAGGPNAVCQIPRPYLQYCTKHVLVMEELKGIKLVTALRQDLEQQAARLGHASAEEFLEKMQFNVQEAETPESATHNGIDPLGKGPSAADYQRWIAVVDSQRRASNLAARIYNLSWGWITGNYRPYQDKSVLPLNHAQLIDDLIHIHGHEVLVDGVFNGDPHPGNILLCRKPDGSPQLGLIDYGQVKRITKADRHLFCKIVLALADENRPEIIRLMKEAGFSSQKMDPDVIYSYAKVAYDEDNKELTKGLHIQMFMEDLQARDPIIALPYDFIVIGRCSLILRGLAHALKQPRSVAKAWKPIAERVLKEDL